VGVLQSARFSQGDAATIRRLEDCATGQPSEVASHFTIGQTGTPVIQLQEALKSVQQSNPGLGIPAFVVNGVYDEAFANAILAYKTKRSSTTLLALRRSEALTAKRGRNQIRPLNRFQKSPAIFRSRWEIACRTKIARHRKVSR
jgi:hypothetical protein